MRKSTLIVGGAIAAALIVGTGTGAYAKTLITGADVKDGSLSIVDLSPLTVHELHGSTGATGKTGATGATGKAGVNGTNGTNGAPGANGKDGKDGDAAFTGAYYSVAFYDVGDTNQGAIATVACSSPTDTAISGGVQSLGLGGNPAAVASSFPGRMDWTTNTPKADRLDGWIVQFDATNAPQKVKVYALCVPNLTIPVNQTYLQSTDG
jgi:hypothetical protein